MHLGETALDHLLAPVRDWFLETLGRPTPAQALGWPPIVRGEHTLILSPTGSGKTLAAFLWTINRLFSEGERTRQAKAVDLLYVSPLKALSNDIEFNLRTPLKGIRAKAREQAIELPAIRVAVRTGDTPSSARVSMLRKPPHILITTPESLYIMLTSPRARELFSDVRTVIVDEIHALCGNKRGVHLALSLERLQELAASNVQRIGLSATQRPLQEVAHFLGGQERTPEGELKPRPVTIVNASYDKPMDLKLMGLVREPKELSGGRLWSIVIPRILGIIRRNRTTLVFCNNRRLAERTADRLNEQFHAEESGEVSPGSTEALAPEGVARGVGMMAAGQREGPFYAHHGSISKERRLRLERDLRAGRLSALVGTSSLELGIDIGSADVVVQLQSPKSVTRGLQRVGRSGHMVGQTSVGYIFPTHGQDVMETAVVARGMLDGEVEETYAPQNCLDVLAQQVAAAVAVEPWDVRELYGVIRRAYPYQDLPWPAYESVLGMLSGKYTEGLSQVLRPRIDWDRTNNVLSPLPGTRMLAITNGGTITDRGAFAVYLADGKTRVGELDEEFVYETRAGDVFTLGSQVWRTIDIGPDRVTVEQAPGSLPRMPFWRGDYPWRSYDLGLKIGQLQREVAEHLQGGKAPQEAFDATVRWLQTRYPLDEDAARQVATLAAQQLDATGVVTSDRTLLLEVFQDSLGDYRLVVHSPFGGKVNGTWALALAALLRERTGIDPEVQVNDEGILFRLAGFEEEPPLDILEWLSPEKARELILAELPSSALFGAQFRQNAARALLLPGRGPRRRTPFWLQRLRAKDLLQMVKRLDDFPIVMETYRDCLTEVLDLPHLEEVLRGIQSGRIRVVPLHTLAPSPGASALLYDLINVYMYEWDTPKAERQLQALSVNWELVSELCRDPALAQLLRPEAVVSVRQQAERTAPGSRARSVEELALLLEEQGDLTTEELMGRCPAGSQGWLDELVKRRRAIQFAVPTKTGLETRWISMESLPLYQDAFPSEEGQPSEDSRRRILRKFTRHAGPVTLEQIHRRYAFPLLWIEAEMERLTSTGEVVQGRFSDASTAAEWCDVRLLEQMHRRTLTILRRQVRPVPLTQYVYFLTRWQHLHPSERFSGRRGLTEVIQQLQAVPVPGLVWERDVLPARLTDFAPSALEELCQQEHLFWVGTGGADPRRARFRLLLHGQGGALLPPAEADEAIHNLTPEAREVLRFLRSEGGSTADDVRHAVGLHPAALWEALSGLALAGLVSNSSWQSYRDLQDAWLSTADSQPATGLEAQLRQRLGSRRRRSRALRAEIRRRHARESRRRPSWGGRWFPVHRFAVMGKPLSEEERLQRQIEHLLRCYGVICADWVREGELGWRWDLLARQLQLMEMRGQVRRGYFVEGLPGLQFASADAVERLREADSAMRQDGEPVVVNACDPLAVAVQGRVEGLEETMSSKVARVPASYICLRRGQPVLIAQGYGTRLTVSPAFPEEVISRALQALFSILVTTGGTAAPRHGITVATWNGEAAHESPGARLLQSLGFRRDYKGMTRYAL